MTFDSLFDYLRSCGGQDSLTFDTTEKAALAHTVILAQLEADDVPFDLHPSIDQFDCVLRLRLRKEAANEPIKQAKEVRKC